MAITRSGGFTLMEIMVVLVLVGILASLAVLAIGGSPQDRLAEEGQRLAALVALQQQEAILTGQIRGLQFGPHGYAVLSLDEQGAWVAPDTTTLTHRTLPADLALNLWVDLRPAPLETAGFPQVLLLNSGESTDFVVVFKLTEDQLPNAPQYRVAGDALGRLTTGAVAR